MCREKLEIHVVTRSVNEPTVAHCSLCYTDALMWIWHTCTNTVPMWMDGIWSICNSCRAMRTPIFMGQSLEGKVHHRTQSSPAIHGYQHLHVHCTCTMYVFGTWRTRCWDNPGRASRRRWTEVQVNSTSWTSASCQSASTTTMYMYMTRTLCMTVHTIWIIKVLYRK